MSFGYLACDIIMHMFWTFCKYVGHSTQVLDIMPKFWDIMHMCFGHFVFVLNILYVFWTFCMCFGLFVCVLDILYVFWTLCHVLEILC